ncbi:MAG: hypothetical protein Q8Q32_02520 [bacterium]|nr:hypothetical protein [bacterium]
MSFLSKKKKISKKIAPAILLLLILSLVFSSLFANTAFAQDGNSTSTDNLTAKEQAAFENSREQRERDAEGVINFAGTLVNIRWGECDWDELVCGVTKGLRYVILGTLSALGSFFAFLLGLAAVFLKMMVFLGTKIAILPLVTIGFGLTLSFTNVLFILAIIIMAFATILHFDKWSAKTMLKRLIIAAILVNFSFFIAGFILDTTNVFTGVFSEAFDERELGKALNPQQIILAFGTKVDYIKYSDGTSVSGEAADRALKDVQAGAVDKKIIELQTPLNEDDWTQFFKIFQGLLLAVVLTLLLTISLLAVGIMVLVRSFYIGFLLILMPIIWPISVMPVLKERWDQWWAAFMKWAIYLPTVSFFIWLAVRSTQVMNNLGADGVYSEIKVLAGGSTFAYLTLMVFNVLFIVGLIIGGLVVSKKFSLFGSAAGLMAAGWIGSKVKGGSKKAGKYALRNPGKVAGGAAGAALGASGLGALGALAGAGIGYKGGKKAEEGVKRAGRGAARMGSNVASAGATETGVKGFLGRLATGSLTRGGAQETANKLAAKASASERVKKRQAALYGSLSNKQFDAIGQGPLPSGDIDKAAYLMEATKRKKSGELGKFGKDKIKDLMESSQRAFNISQAEDAPSGEGVPGIKEIFNANPELAAEVTGKDIDKILAGMSGSELLQIKKVTPKIAGAMVKKLNEKALMNYYQKASSENSSVLKTRLRRLAAPEVAAQSGEEAARKMLEENIQEISKEISDITSQISKGERNKDSKVNYEQLNATLEKKKKELEEAKKTSVTRSESKEENKDAYRKLKILSQDRISSPDS